MIRARRVRTWKAIAVANLAFAAFFVFKHVLAGEPGVAAMYLVPAIAHRTLWWAACRIEEAYEEARA